MVWVPARHAQILEWWLGLTVLNHGPW